MKPLISTGVSLEYREGGGWAATVEFSTQEHAVATCIEGSVKTRYFDSDLQVVIDRALEAAKAMGITFGSEPLIYVDNDGEGVPVPSNWRALIEEQSVRLGWTCTYTQGPPVNGVAEPT